MHFAGHKVRRTPYMMARKADPARDRDLAGNPLPNDHITFVKTDACEFQGVNANGKKVYRADNAPQAFPMSYESFRHGYTDWKYDKGMRTFRWFVYMYVLIEGEVWVAKILALSPPEVWRNRAFAEKGILVNADGRLVK